MQVKKAADMLVRSVAACRVCLLASSPQRHPNTSNDHLLLSASPDSRTN